MKPSRGCLVTGFVLSIAACSLGGATSGPPDDELIAAAKAEVADRTGVDPGRAFGPFVSTGGQCRSVTVVVPLGPTLTSVDVVFREGEILDLYVDVIDGLLSDAEEDCLRGNPLRLR